MNKALLITISELGLALVAGTMVGVATVKNLGGLKKLSAHRDHRTKDIPYEDLDVEEYEDIE